MPAAGAPTSPGAAKKPRRSRLGAAGRLALIIPGTIGLGAWIIGAWFTFQYRSAIPITGGRSYWIGTGGGLIGFGWNDTPSLAGLPRGILRTERQFDVRWTEKWSWWTWIMLPRAGKSRMLFVMVPGCLLAAPLMPVIFIDLRSRLHRSRAPGHCPCGYDLAGLPAAATVCPECGRERAEKVVAA